MISIDQKILANFCFFVDKLGDRGPVVFERVTKDHLRVRYTSEFGNFSAHVLLGCSEDFGTFGVDSSKLSSVVKNLNGEITLNVEQNRVVLSQGNSTVKFPTLQEVSDFVEFSKMNKIEIGPLVAPLTKLSQLKDVSDLGVLIEDSTIYKMLGSSLQIFEVSGKYPKFVLPSSLGAVLKTSSLIEASLSERLISFMFENGIVVTHSLLENRYMNNLKGVLKMDSLSLETSYRASRDNVIGALSSVLAVVGDEPFVKFCAVGRDDDDALVWELTARDFAGHEARELFTTSGAEPAEFLVNGKILLGFLKLCGPSIFFVNFSPAHLVVCNEDKNEISYVNKISM